VLSVKPDWEAMGWAGESHQYDQWIPARGPDVQELAISTPGQFQAFHPQVSPRATSGPHPCLSRHSLQQPSTSDCWRAEPLRACATPPARQALSELREDAARRAAPAAHLLLARHCSAAGDGRAGRQESGGRRAGRQESGRKEGAS
jgi:hypothetical protein